MKLQHDDGTNYRPSKVTVHYDNHVKNLEVDENGTVEVENKLEAQELQTSHGKFFPVNEDEENSLPDYVLENKNVAEVEEYIREIADVSRLKELRQKEDRKTAIQAIDSRIAELQEQQEEVDENQEEKSDEQENDDEEDSQEDGEETEE